MPATPDEPTLRALLRRSDLHLVLKTPEADLDDGALDRPIRWVHSSDLADPTPFLADGVVLLTTGTQFLDDGVNDGGYAAYTARLRLRGVVGLGFGTEVVRDGIPLELTEACLADGITLFEVPYRTPFIAVARANAEATAAQAFARRSWALAAQRALSLAALRPDGLAATITELGKQLECWVGLYDASGTRTHEHPVGSMDAASSADLDEVVSGVLVKGVRSGSALRVGSQAITLQTLGRGGRLRGVIAIARGDLDEEGRGVVTAVVAMAGLALEQQQGFNRARAQLRAGLVQSLLTGDPTLARRIARDQWGGLPAGPIVVAVSDGAIARSAAASEWLELRSHERAGQLFFGRGDDGLVIVVPAEHADALAAVRGFAARFEVTLGLSTPVGYDGFARAVQQAVAARDAALREGPGVYPFADLAARSILTQLATPAVRATADAVLAPLKSHDHTQGTELVETLRVWLEHDAEHEAAARALGVHRHTVRARIGVAQGLLGRDLGSFAERAQLWIALNTAS